MITAPTAVTTVDPGRLLASAGEARPAGHVPFAALLEGVLADEPPQTVRPGGHAEQVPGGQAGEGPEKAKDEESDASAAGALAAAHAVAAAATAAAPAPPPPGQQAGEAAAVPDEQGRASTANATLAGTGLGRPAPAGPAPRPEVVALGSPVGLGTTITPATSGGVPSMAADPVPAVPQGSELGEPPAGAPPVAVPSPAPAETPPATPAREAPLEQAPLEQAPLEQAPPAEAPVAEAPRLEAPAGEAPPVETAPIEAPATPPRLTAPGTGEAAAEAPVAASPVVGVPDDEDSDEGSGDVVGELPDLVELDPARSGERATNFLDSGPMVEASGLGVASASADSTAVAGPDLSADSGSRLADPAPPHEQLAEVVAPLRRRPDGSYRLSVQLRPAELGQIEVTVELRHGMVHLQLNAASDGAREVLRSALPQLRAQLEASGLDTGKLDLTGQGDQRDRAGTATRTGRERGGASSDDESEASAFRHHRPSRDRTLDIHL